MAHFLLRLSTLIAASVALAGPTLAQVSQPSATAARAASWAPDLTFVVDGGEDGPIEAGAWLPLPAADGRPAPLIVVSHGNGGEYRGHADTARALAEAGFVVAALTHPRDNYRDLSRSTQLTARAPQLSRLIDHMAGERFARISPTAVDPGRIGAFGFSAGGFTVTNAIGGVSDLARIETHCADQADDFACRLIALQPVDAAAWRPDVRDDRIKAAVIAAPALGYSFTAASLAGISIPVQLWRAEDDQILPSPHNVEPIRDRLPAVTEYRVVEGAGHYDFLPPCSPALAQAAPAICTPTPGFDRAAFHETFNRDVVSFFRERL
jgi:predicted dienelactone hydrolase